eukprot:6855855-Karenia_brevis.AAC.1
MDDADAAGVLPSVVVVVGEGCAIPTSVATSMNVFRNPAKAWGSDNASGRYLSFSACPKASNLTGSAYEDVDEG